jgi:branched-chain amino acid aminotransferase
MITLKILGDRYVKNNETADVSGYIPDMSADIYYEVIRLMDGKVLFLKDHLERLDRSLTGSGIEYPGKSRITENLALLVKENPFREGNIRISLQRSNGGEAQLLCYFIPYFYPDIRMYEKGVKMLIYPHVRPNPGIKKWDDSFRRSVSAFIAENSIYEVALKNHKSQITEGSRSNIFFIDEKGWIITPPAGDVLMGITRKHLLDIAVRNSIPLEEKPIPVESLKGMVSAFISGTSPKVLPVKQIDQYPFNVNHPVLKKLMTAFEGLIRQNLTSL